MTVKVKSKERPRIDIKLHKPLEKEFYDVQIIFRDNKVQAWYRLNENEVMWLCEKYSPISTPLSVAIAPRFLPKSHIEKPNWESRKG
ncbi:histidinol-phosphate/aromatic aminotransferase and cobyric acid decarboxylase [Lactococcus taiwanensis]|uniref:Histidinol-phosphate/aromatic aminotransferase and cobyric acid decarboxylase n=1 Tax=Lactococcus taiwanensis TaxID=1151742 RepID=A0AA45KGN8_9LACT|nr:histidinol-phosphate/aromatic aminotransferase and cobyric acid decarboxylase [Lactococcus taiwanensis]QSE76696.1 histidinol-phosphate/aromatic aminotransferase and cobyric acid decarboxylase [Lactococcus taiwanensis]